MRSSIVVGLAALSGALLGAFASPAVAADGTVFFEQGLGTFNGSIGGGEFGAYNFSNPGILAPIAAPVKVAPNDFQTFCLEPGVHLLFNQVLDYTVATTVSAPGGGTRNLTPQAAYLYTKFWNATAFVPAYAYAPLGAGGRVPAARDMQAALWFVEGVWGNPFNTLPANAQTYVLEADAAVAPGGSWATAWGTTFPGNLGTVRVLNIVSQTTGENLQDVLVLLAGSPPPPPPGDPGDSVGHTPGFWQNKNGQKLIDDADLLALRNLNLVLADGSAFDPTTKQQVGNWINGTKATNMAAKLSSFVAAMTLNVRNGFVDEDDLVYCSTLVDPSGKISIAALLTLANTELGAHPICLTGSPFRAYQSALKDALDDACNNLNWV